MSETASLPPEVIRWQRAYEAANQKPAPLVSYYGHGWYTIDDRRPKRRVREFTEWAERLEFRVRNQAVSPHPIEEQSR